MRYKKLQSMVAGLIMAFTLPLLFGACGPVRSYWGVEGEYDLPYGGEGGYYYQQEHHHKKHKKHKRHKKYKKRHHHDDDDVTWDYGFADVPL